MDKKQPIIECRGLGKSFRVRRREIPVLKDLEFAVSPGEVAVIKSRSGAGKSVLMWLLAGLDHPTEGSIFFEGESLTGASNSRLSALRAKNIGIMSLTGASNSRLSALRAKNIGIIFQNFNLVTSWTALENVVAAIEQNGVSPSDTRARSVEILTTLGLGDRLDNLPAELSIGQQQRVAVARTLVANPSLILADEPTGDVDPETATEIVDLLMAEVKGRGATLVVTTHGHFPYDCADRVLELKDSLLFSVEK